MFNATPLLNSLEVPANALKTSHFLDMNVYHAKLSGVSNVKYPTLITVKSALRKHNWERVDSASAKILPTSPPMKAPASCAKLRAASFVKLALKTPA